MKKFTTEFGVVSVSKPYFNYTIMEEVVDLMLIPPDLDGWGVSWSAPPDTQMNQQKAQEWASEAIRMLKD